MKCKPKSQIKVELAEAKAKISRLNRFTFDYEDNYLYLIFQKKCEVLQQQLQEIEKQKRKAIEIQENVCVATQEIQKAFDQMRAIKAKYKVEWE